MSEETIAQRVIRVIAKNKKMAPEELSPATRFDDLKMDSLDALSMIFALNCRIVVASAPNSGERR